MQTKTNLSWVKKKKKKKKPSSSLAAVTTKNQINKSEKFVTFQILRFERCAVICTKTIWMQRTVSSMLLPRLLARSSTSNCRWSHKKRDNAAGGTPGLMRAQMPYAKKIGKGIHFSKSNISRLNATIKLPHKDCFPGRYKRLEQDANWQVPTLVLRLHTRGLGTSQKVQKEVSLSVCLHCDDKVDTMKRAKKSVCLTTT